MSEPVYLLTMEGVYDHGSAGIFTTRAAATEHALALDAKSDGYHTWRIDEMVVDEPRITSPLTYSRVIGQGRPSAVEFVSRELATTREDG